MNLSQCFVHWSGNMHTLLAYKRVTSALDLINAKKWLGTLYEIRSDYWSYIFEANYALPIDLGNPGVRITWSLFNVRLDVTWMYCTGLVNYLYCKLNVLLVANNCTLLLLPIYFAPVYHTYHYSTTGQPHVPRNMVRYLILSHAIKATLAVACLWLLSFFTVFLAYFSHYISCFW